MYVLTSSEVPHIRQLFPLAAKYISIISQISIDFFHLSLSLWRLTWDQREVSPTPICNPTRTHVVRNTWSPSCRRRFFYILFFFYHNLCIKEGHMSHFLATCSHTWSLQMHIKPTKHSGYKTGSWALTSKLSTQCNYVFRETIRKITDYFLKWNQPTGLF